jgi:hypothetical protein
VVRPIATSKANIIFARDRHDAIVAKPPTVTVQRPYLVREPHEVRARTFGEHRRTSNPEATLS